MNCDEFVFRYWARNVIVSQRLYDEQHVLYMDNYYGIVFGYIYQL